MNKKMTAIWMVGMAALASAGSLSAHHSLAMFDTEGPIWIKGTVVRFERINPHSRIYIDRKREDGQVQRWTVDGPSLIQLDRMTVEQDFLQAGDVIEVCGFGLKDDVSSQRADPEVDNSSADSVERNASGQFMNGHLLVMPDGERRFWSDYGQIQKCVGPDELDALARWRQRF